MILLALDQTSKQRRSDPQCCLGPSDSALDDTFEDRVGLYDVELGAVELAGSGLEQSCLEELDGSCNAE